jgi:hypothetical protein
MPQVAQSAAFYTERALLGPYSIAGRDVGADCNGAVGDDGDVPMSSLKFKFEL